MISSSLLGVCSLTVYFVHQISARGVMVMPKLSDTGLLEIDPSNNGSVWFGSQEALFVLEMTKFLSQPSLTPPGKLYVCFQTPEECVQVLHSSYILLLYISLQFVVHFCLHRH